MTWLYALAKGLLEALFGWGQKQAEKPTTTQNANTPPDIKHNWDRYIAEQLRLRDQNGDRR
jgi:hypothetical protein